QPLRRTSPCSSRIAKSICSRLLHDNGLSFSRMASGGDVRRPRKTPWIVHRKTGPPRARQQNSRRNFEKTRAKSSRFARREREPVHHLAAPASGARLSR